MAGAFVSLLIFSNPFKLLDESDGNDSITVQTTSARGRPLKRTQPFEPNSPPRAKRANSTKATTSQTVQTPVDTDQWAQVKALLTRVESALLAAERRAEKAEKRIETLEEFVRNELFPRINTPPPRAGSPPLSPPSSLPPSVAPGQIPGREMQAPCADV